MSVCFLQKIVPIITWNVVRTNIRTSITCSKSYQRYNSETNELNRIGLSNGLSSRRISTGSSVATRLRNGRKDTHLKENSKLTEVITIYEKLTKSKGRSEEVVFRFSDLTKIKSSDVEESATVLDFSKFRDIHNQNYSYFSAKTGLIQAHSLNTLEWKNSSTASMNSSDLIMNSRNFCLGVINPTEDDLLLLGTHLHVHDLTLKDIREQNTEEKLEVFKNYTFISFKVYLDAGENRTDPLPRGKKEDLNILMFPDSEITIILHYGKPWTGFKDMLGFLNLLCNYGHSSLTPDWVLFSIIIELTQDAKFGVQQLEPKIINLKIANSDSVHTPSHVITDINANPDDLSQVLTKNFENEFEIYRINRFIKPKIRVLKELDVKGNSRFSPKVLDLLSGTRKDLEEIGEALGHFNHILERSQDTCLTLANVRQSQEANEMGRMMKRLSEVALLFLPLQAMAGFLGMNVKIPFQNLESTAPFWIIVASSSALVIVVYRISQIASKNVAPKLKHTNQKL